MGVTRSMGETRIPKIQMFCGMRSCRLVGCFLYTAGACRLHHPEGGSCQPRNLSQNLSIDTAEQFVAGPLPRRSGLDRRSVHVGLLLDKMPPRQVFLQVLRFSCAILIISLLRIQSFVLSC
jgi:hypothetical protein